ncbi:MAG: glycosyltransferase [Planctomycetales bacterium]|nr:glycosyltransferase [Planctomycetales bacterium]
MKIAIGIMLWNEEQTIGMTIDSIFSQTLLSEIKSNVESVEVVALANGCTDQSIPNARDAFSRNLAKCVLPCVQARVEELPKGRSPAWNWFVHERTSPDTSYILFMDADITINNHNAMWSMIDGLENSEYHPVAGALGIKDIDLQEHKTLLQRTTSSFTKMEQDARHFYLCGGLYCGRASFFRRIEFPKGFVCGDDGFIASMAITNFWTSDYEFDRILHPADATFVFESYSTLPRLFKQHRRRMVGSVVRTMILDYVRSKQSGGVPDAGSIIRNACQENPLWLEEHCRQQIAALGFWVVPPRTIFYRLTQLRRLSLWKKIARFPLAIVGTLWQAAVIVSANRAFHSGQYANVWTSMPNTRMMSPSETALTETNEQTVVRS